MKRFISILVTATMLFTLLAAMTFSISAETYSGNCGSNLTWTLDTETGELTITGTGRMHYSTAYAPWNTYSGYIKTVNIEDGVESIGTAAFKGCTNLTDITIPNTVTSIGYEAFYQCSKLPSITIPEGITSIDNYVFLNCFSLKDIYIKDVESWLNVSLGMGSLPSYYTLHILDENDAEVTDLVIPNTVSTIRSNAFNCCENLTNVMIPDNVISIERYAFSGCTGLKNVYLGNGVTKIGERAFGNCTLLDHINIPNSVTDIEDYTFTSCVNLKNITLFNSVISIGDYAFANCNSLTNVNYYGTENDWIETTIGSSNEPLLNATRNYIYGSETFNSASVRVSSEHPGLRFKTAVDKEALEELIATYGKENIEIGTIIVPTDTVTELDMITVAALDAANIKYMKVHAIIDTPYSSSDTTNVYAGSIVNLKSANLGRNFTGVGYIAITKSNGEVVYYYSSTTATRNVSYIASCAIADTSETQVNEYKYEFLVGEKVYYSPYTTTQREILDKLIVK